MSLKDHVTTQTMPAFEDETETEIMTTTTIDAPAAAAATTAIAQAQATAVAAAKPKMAAAYAEFQDVFDADTVAGMALSVPAIKGQQGACYHEMTSFGERIKLEVISWNYRWMITSGLQNKDPGYEESKQWIANSYDGVTVHGRDMSVEDYLHMLREEHAYNKASKSQYIDLFGLVVWKEKGGDVPEADREMYRVQLSQTSAGAFTAFCATQGALMSRGIVKEQSPFIEVKAEARSKGTNMYTNFSFKAAK